MILQEGPTTGSQTTTHSISRKQRIYCKKGPSPQQNTSCKRASWYSMQRKYDMPCTGASLTELLASCISYLVARAFNSACCYHGLLQPTGGFFFVGCGCKALWQFTGMAIYHRNLLLPDCTGMWPCNSAPSLTLAATLPESHPGVNMIQPTKSTSLAFAVTCWYWGVA